VVLEQADEAVAANSEGSAQSGEAWERGQNPCIGKFKIVMTQLRAGRKEEALTTANGWHEEQPGDVMALVAMGEALEALGDKARAARAYGSIIDLFPSRADMRRYAGVRLEHVRAADALSLAADT